jgi:death-on-curing protein
MSILNEQVLTLGDTAELVISHDILKQIGVGAGDRIEIAISDRALVVRSLEEAENRAYYENAGLAICAATYGYHLTQAHDFIDGNKRIAAAVSELFLSINDARLELTNDEIVDLFLGIASSQITRDEVKRIFTQRVTVVE